MTNFKRCYTHEVSSRLGHAEQKYVARHCRGTKSLCGGHLMTATSKRLRLENGGLQVAQVEDVRDNAAAFLSGNRAVTAVI